MEKEDKMKKGKYLEGDKKDAIKILLRRKAELEYRVTTQKGSEQSLQFDEREMSALEVAIDALSKN